MGPEDKDDELDDLLNEDEVEDTPEQEEAPKDIRGAIKHAIKVESDKGDDGPEEPKAKEVKAPKEKTEQRAVKKVEETEEIESQEPKSKKDKTEKSEKLVPPPGWTKEGKATWDTLPPDAQKSVLKREEEVSRGIAQYAAKAKAYDEFDQVLAPRREAIQRFGVSGPQVVDRLFQWMEALSDQNLSNKAHAFKALAQSFGLPIERLIPQAQSEETPAETNNQPPEWFNQFASAVENKIGTIEQQSTLQRQAAASSVLNNWAKDKSHFQAVRPLMYQLIQGGIVPLKDGEIDLDGAYEQAIKLSPEVSAQVQQEAAEKIKLEAAAQAKKDATLAAARAAKARNAGSGLKPAASSVNTVPSKTKPNGSGKSVSVRDSLALSMKELRDN